MAAEMEKFMASIVLQICMFCHGTGFVYAPKKRKCRVCRGKGKL